MPDFWHTSLPLKHDLMMAVSLYSLGHSLTFCNVSRNTVDKLNLRAQDINNLRTVTCNLKRQQTFEGTYINFNMCMGASYWQLFSVSFKLVSV